MKAVSSAMKFEKTGVVKSKRTDIVRGQFKDYTVSEMTLNVIRELYGRFDTEVWAFAACITWAVILWSKLS